MMSLKRPAPAPSSEELWRAIARGEDDLVGELLERGADPDATGQSPHPLVIAVRRNNLRLVSMLLAAKADPNGGSPNVEFVPLSECTDPALASALLAAGANIEAINARGWSPLHVLAARGDHLHGILLMVS